jgi:hypothetical protein
MFPEDTAECSATSFGVEAPFSISRLTTGGWLFTATKVEGELLTAVKPPGLELTAVNPDAMGGRGGGASTGGAGLSGLLSVSRIDAFNAAEACMVGDSVRRLDGV